MASNQVTPTTGWSGAQNAGAVHQGGSGVRPTARKRAYSRLVTGVRLMRNGATATEWTGCSSGRPESEPMRKRPPGTRTVIGAGALRRETPREPVAIANSYPETTYEL